MIIMWGDVNLQMTHLSFIVGITKVLYMAMIYMIISKRLQKKNSWQSNFRYYLYQQWYCSQLLRFHNYNIGFKDKKLTLTNQLRFQKLYFLHGIQSYQYPNPNPLPSHIIEIKILSKRSYSMSLHELIATFSIIFF